MNKTEKENILIVDDRPENLLALERLLKRPDLNIIRATSGNDALAMVLEHDFALILLDVQMPDMDGFETAELMRENDETKRIPIIFVTAISKEQKYVFKGYDAGAVDYLFKPLDPDILKSKVNVFLELHKQKTSLEKMNEELRKANKKMWEQQKAVIEEERLKVLLQMAGATAYEFNQPLTSLLENIKLIKTDNKEGSEHIIQIQKAGEMISGIVEKIRTIHHYEIEPRSSEFSITDPGQKTRILLVDDSDDAFEIIKETLRDINFTDLSRAVNIKEALAVLKQDKFDLILLDHFLDDGTGFDFLASIAKEGIEIPVVVVTAFGDEMLVSQMIQSGAYDYLPKNKLSTESLSRAINNAIDKARLKAEAKKAQARMAEMSTIDELTKLANRRYFMEALEGELERARRYKNEMMLVIMDLDHFKKVNDTYGHLAGDMVLSEIGKELKEHVRYNDLASRYGGEELAVILPNTNQDSACIAYERFRKMVEERLFIHGSSQFNIRVSIGIASSNDSNSLNDLIAHADLALYKAKETGRNKVITYTPEEKKT
ncbi:MAG: diguanylate cyclase [Candidatus Scalindua sediminis]|nr:diguanylate cyclase [Candidatus Scalindua sediminis]